MPKYNPDGTVSQFDTLEDGNTIRLQMAYENAKRKDGVEGGGVMRGQLPQFGPGEFDELTNARAFRHPTAYGATKQRQYNIARSGNQLMGLQNRYSSLAGLRRTADFNRLSGRDTPENTHQLQSLLKLYGPK